MASTVSTVAAPAPIEAATTSVLPPLGAIPDAPAATAPHGGDVALTNVLLLVMALLWGINFSVLKVGTRYVAPVAFNGARILLATAVLSAIAAARRERTPSRADVVRLVLLGVLGHGLYQYFFIEGIARTAVGTTALVLAASPAFIGIVGRLLGIERPTRRAWLGIGLQLLGMAGVVAGSAAGDGGASGGATIAGLAFIVAAAVTWAFYAVLLKPLAERVDQMHLSAWTLVGGALTLGVAALPALARVDAAHVPAPAWLAVGYSGLLAMVVAYLFYYRGVRVVGPVRTAMFSNLQPIVALVVAFLTLGERPGLPQLVGAALIAAGLLVSSR